MIQKIKTFYNKYTLAKNIDYIQTSIRRIKNTGMSHNLEKNWTLDDELLNTLKENWEGYIEQSKQDAVNNLTKRLEELELELSAYDKEEI